MLQKTIWLQISIMLMIAVLVFQFSRLYDMHIIDWTMPGDSGLQLKTGASKSPTDSDRQAMSVSNHQGDSLLVRRVFKKEALSLSKYENDTFLIKTDLRAAVSDEPQNAFSSDPAASDDALSDFSCDTDSQKPALNVSITSGCLIPLSEDAGGSLSVFASQDGFGCQMELQPQIGYFNGETNLQGTDLPDTPGRLLGSETLVISLQFSEPPSRIEVSLGSESVLLFGHPGRSVYTVNLRAPADDETLNWSHQRLADPLDLVLFATPHSNPQTELTVILPGIEITGHVRHLVHVQPVRSP